MTSLVFGAMVVSGFLACASGSFIDRNRTLQEFQARRYWDRLRDERGESV